MKYSAGRVNADGSVTVLFKGLAGPEGLVVLADGTLIVAEQDTNRVLAFAPGSKTLRPRTLRVLPGTSSSAPCKHGVDGIAFDPTTNTLIIPDSPTGSIYRMSLDGKTFTLLASGRDLSSHRVSLLIRRATFSSRTIMQTSS